MMQAEVRTEPIAMSDETIIEWIGKNQVLYAEGLLPHWQVRRLEAIPNWRWDASGYSPEFRAKVLEEYKA